MTLSRNSPEVVQCKVDLVTAFSKAKDLLKQRQETVKQIPYWYQRMRLALSDTEQPLEVGYFCIYQEMMRFFSELEGRQISEQAGICREAVRRATKSPV